MASLGASFGRKTRENEKDVLIDNGYDQTIQYLKKFDILNKIIKN